MGLIKKEQKFCIESNTDTPHRKNDKFEYISSKDLHVNLHFKNVQFYWKSFRRKLCTVILEYILNTLKTLPRRSSRA